MRKGIEVEVGAGDRARLEAIVADRNRRRKHVERARIVLLTADGVGTMAIMRQVGCAKAMAGAVQGRGRRGPAARPEPAAGQGAAGPSCGRASG